jgi:hypothetical protein
MCAAMRVRGCERERLLVSVMRKQSAESSIIVNVDGALADAFGFDPVVGDVTV